MAESVVHDIRDYPSAARAWVALALFLAIGAVLARRIDPQLIDWEPWLAATQPWRAFTAVFVHYSHMHLVANLAGALLVSALGYVGRLPARCVLAWLASWPITQFGLLLQPELQHFGGLSGVLHAGVAVVCVHLLAVGTRVQRRIATALAAGLIAKIVSEVPWQGALSHPIGWDIAVAPFAHVTGAAAGALCSWVGEIWCRIRK